MWSTRRRWAKSSSATETLRSRTWEELSDPCDDQEEILRWAFKPDEFVCIGGAQVWDFNTLPREAAIKHASTLRVHRPEPVQVPLGPHAGGEALEEEREPGPRAPLRGGRVRLARFRLDDWLHALGEARLPGSAPLPLSREFPLALVVFSGNESAHGWYVTKRPHYLRSEAESIGADPRPMGAFAIHEDAMGYPRERSAAASHLLLSIEFRAQQMSNSNDSSRAGRHPRARRQNPRP